MVPKVLRIRKIAKVLIFCKHELSQIGRKRIQYFAILIFKWLNYIYFLMVVFQKCKAFPKMFFEEVINGNDLIQM